MIQGIDHIVILVDDLAAAIASYTHLGFTVVPGGEHTGGETHNALVVFEESSQEHSTYLELIAFKRVAPAHRWWRHTVTGEGLIDFALLPKAIADDINAARQRGLAFEGPIPGGRLRPDGQPIAWHLGAPLTPDLPFLCADVTPRALRVPDGSALQHTNGVVGIAQITVAVNDINTSAARYRALLGVEPRLDWVSPESDAQVAAFPVGASTILLATPGSAARSRLRDHLRTRGEGPYALSLRVGTGIGTTLDPARTHGVRVELVT